MNPQATHTPQPNVIIGLGNEIAGDDGVGIWIARTLERMVANHIEVGVIALPWAGFALLDALSGRRRAAIIDCLCTGCHAPGTIVRLDENDMRGSVRLNSFHDLNYPTVLALGRQMGWQMPQEIAIWGIEGAEIDNFKEGLSPAVERAAIRVIDEICDFYKLEMSLLRPISVAQYPT